MRLEALRSAEERDYLVAVYQEMEVPVSAPDGEEGKPAPHPRTVRVWTGVII